VRIASGRDARRGTADHCPSKRLRYKHKSKCLARDILQRCERASETEGHGVGRWNYSTQCARVWCVSDRHRGPEYERLNAWHRPQLYVRHYGDFTCKPSELLIAISILGLCLS
jgi:hypothetical protein